MNQQYYENRAKIPLEELRRFADQWVAISMDGRQVIAGASTLEELEMRLAADGVDAETVGFERIEFEDSYIGGAETL